MIQGQSCLLDQMVVEFPVVTEVLPGCRVIAGGVQPVTVTVAVLLSAVPQELVTRTQ